MSRADRFRVETDAGSIEAASLVLATGGLSIPKLGATGLSHDVAQRFGLELTGIRPGLVPLLLGGAALSQMAGLAGVSARVGASCGKTRFDEGMVVTHRGLSGPAILQISSVWREGEAACIDLLPQAAEGFLKAHKRARPKAALRGVLGEVLPSAPGRCFPTAQRCRAPDRRCAGSPSCRSRDSLAHLAGSPDRYRRVCQGRGNAGRRGHHGAVAANHAVQRGAWPVRDRRGGGRDRLAGRLQFPMGLGQRLRCGRGCVMMSMAGLL